MEQCCISLNELKSGTLASELSKETLVYTFFGFFHNRVAYLSEQ